MMYGLPIISAGILLFAAFAVSALAGVLDVAGVLLVLAVLCCMIGVSMK